MIGHSPRVEVAPSSVSRNRGKENQFWNGGRDEQIGVNTVAKTSGEESGKNLGQEEPMLSSQSYIYIYKILPAHKRENTLRRNLSKS